MSRRIVPETFRAGILACVLLLLAEWVWASKPSAVVPPDLGGPWDGFFQDTDSGAVGLVRSDLTGQDHRRIMGEGMLLDLMGNVITPYDLDATVTGADSIVGTGQTPTGRLVYHADLGTFPGVDTGAGVQLARYHFVPVRGGEKGVDATLLHPFMDLDAPDISGMGTGIFKSQSDPSFTGTIVVNIAPADDRGAFPGHIDLIPDSPGQPRLSWGLRATTGGAMTSGANRFVVIAQGKTGRFFGDGAVLPHRGDGGSPIPVWGVYRIQLIEGRTSYLAINFNVASLFVNPVP
jgi:hypothetical protein